MNNILETKNLVKHYDGVAAIDGLSVYIEKGKVTSVIGPNGSGKTTLVNVLSGVTEISSGVIVVSGVVVGKLRANEVAAYGITRTFQEVRLFNQMPVLDNILVTLTERNVFGALFEKHHALHLKRTEELLTKVGLWEKRHELAANLSYGQRKLLEIARALAMTHSTPFINSRKGGSGQASEIFLLDEPFAGLFPEMVKIIVGIIKELRAEEKTVVLIEHNMDLIRELSDHVVVMDGGKLLARGNPKEVLEKKEVIEAYLGE
jgi:branched-chain amino acid transport system ATP-binding protein